MIVRLYTSSSDLAKFLLKLFMAFNLLIISFTLINEFQRIYNTEPGHYKAHYSYLKDSKESIGGIVIGSSRAVHAFKPSILNRTGIRFFNFALNGAGPEFFYDWYNTLFLQSTFSPSICIISIDFFMFDSEWLSRKVSQDSEHFPPLVFCKELIYGDTFKMKDLLINRLPFLKYRSQIKESLQFNKGDKRFEMSDYDRGYVSYNIPFNNNNFCPNLKSQFDETQIYFFEELVLQLKSDNKKLFFVMPPDFEVSAEEYQAMKTINLVQQMACELDIPFLNYGIDRRSSLNNDINCYADWQHFNNWGSTIFSEFLADDLVNLGVNCN